MKLKSSKCTDNSAIASLKIWWDKYLNLKSIGTKRSKISLFCMILKYPPKLEGEGAITPVVVAAMVLNNHQKPFACQMFSQLASKWL